MSGINKRYVFDGIVPDELDFVERHIELGVDSEEKMWAFPPQYGMTIGEESECLGRQSYYKADKEAGDTKRLDAVLQAGIARSYRGMFSREVNGKSCCIPAEVFYLPYKDPEHIRYLPTALEPVSNAINTESELDVEILLSDGDSATRSILVSVKTHGAFAVSFMNLVEDIESVIGEMADENKAGIRWCGDEDEEAIEVVFFDELGWESIACFESIRELMRYIVSIRAVRVVNRIVNLSSEERILF